MESQTKIEYTAALAECQRNSNLIRDLVDGLLIQYCANKEGVEKEFMRIFERHKAAMEDFDRSWLGAFISQYIAHRLFRENGYIRTYLRRPLVSGRDKTEAEFLRFQADHPWVFSVCAIEEQHDSDFYTMSDILREEPFLLYSPGLSRVRRDEPRANRFLVLRSFNGHCWQTYGPLAYFTWVTPHDLLYVGQLLRPDLTSVVGLIALIEEQPIPFGILWQAAWGPLPYHGEDQVVMASSDFEVDDFVPAEHAKKFALKTNRGVTEMTLKRWGTPPHFARCYCDPVQRRLFLTAATLRGYEKLTETLGAEGYTFPQMPQTLVSMPVFIAANRMFGKKHRTSPYEHLFAEEDSESSKELLGKAKQAMDEIVTALNNRKSIDIAKLAARYGLDVEEVRGMEQAVRTAFARAEKRTGKRRK